MLQPQYFIDLMLFLFRSYDIQLGSSLIGSGASGQSLTAPNMIDGFWVSLHTAFPGLGAQNTSEVTTGQYQNYVRRKIGRQAPPNESWEGDHSMLNDVGLTWPVAGAASAGCTITHVGLGRDQSGAGVLYCSGSLRTSSVVSPIIQHEISYVVTTGTAHEVYADQASYASPVRVEVYPIYDYALPTGLTAGVPYYAKNLPIAPVGNVFRLYSDSAATVPVNITMRGPLFVTRTSTGTVIPAGGANTYVYMRSYATPGLGVSLSA